MKRSLLLPLTIRQALLQARKKLRMSPIAEPSLDAEVLLGHVVALDRAGLYREWERELTEEEERLLEELLARRLQGEPVAYLTGHKEFMGLDFKVTPAVLIPRPETELLVETALQLLQPDALVIDVGTGSGAIAVSLARHLPQGRVFATDLSQEALRVARENAVGNSVSVRFYQGDLLTPLKGVVPFGAADLIAANLPYIPSADLAKLPLSVREYEPALALDGGEDGLELYRRLIPEAALFLKKGGYLLLEIGFDQAEAALKLLRENWETAVKQDLAGWDRLVVARLAR